MIEAAFQHKLLEVLASIAVSSHRQADALCEIRDELKRQRSDTPARQHAKYSKPKVK